MSDTSEFAQHVIDRTRPRESLSRNDGQILVLLAVALFVILGFVGMAIDVGYLLAERRGAQNAADAAAMAAGRELIRYRDVNQARPEAESAALSYAERNNYGVGSDSIRVEFPDDDRVRVEIDHDVRSFFIRALYDGPWSVSVSAEVLANGEDEPWSMIALGEDGDGITFGGNSNVNVEGSIGSNSDMTFNSSGGGALSGFVDGNLSSHGTMGTPPSSFEHSGWRSGNQGIISDPFEGMDPPDCSSLPSGTYEEDPHHSNSVVLHPGEFRANDLPTGADRRHYSLLPGVYCFRSQVQVNSAGSDGGMFRSVNEDYMENGYIEPDDGGPAGGVLLYFHAGGRISFNSANFQVRAIGKSPYSSTHCDVTQACDREVAVWFAEPPPSPGCQDFEVTSNRTNIIWGHFYAPCSTVSLAGTPGSLINGMVVGHEIDVAGNVSFDIVRDDDLAGELPVVHLIQ
jgi:hypothetical protein